MTGRIACLLFFLAFSADAYALFEKGGALSPGAEASALGDAFCARTASTDAIGYNPSGIADYGKFGVSASYGSILNNKILSANFSVTNYFAPYFTAGVFYNRLISPETDTSENLCALTLATRLFKNSGAEVGAGLSAKYMAAHYGIKASAWGGDIGLFYRLNRFLAAESITVGISLQDPATVIRWENGLEEKAQSLIRSGVLYAYDSALSFSSDINIRERANKGNYDYILRLGAEKRINFAVFRAGFSGFDKNNMSLAAGLGIIAGDYKVDYAYINQLATDSSHKVTLKYEKELLQKDYVEPPSGVKVYEGDSIIYVEWISQYDNVEEFRVYAAKEGGKELLKSVPGGRGEVNFIIRGLENSNKYTIQITSVIKGRESERTERITAVPRKMPREIKAFYKKAKVLYIVSRYDEARRVLEEAIRKDSQNADLILYKRNIENVIRTSK